MEQKSALISEVEIQKVPLLVRCPYFKIHLGWGKVSCLERCLHFRGVLIQRFHHTVFHAKRVDCAIFHLLVYISGILHARPTYDISSRSPIFGDHFDTNDKVSHDSHVTQLAEEVTRF